MDLISNYTDGLRRHDYHGAFPRLMSAIKYRNILLIDTTGIFKKYIFFNGHIIGEENPAFGNLIINWPRLKKYRKR